MTKNLPAFFGIRLLTLAFLLGVLLLPYDNSAAQDTANPDDILFVSNKTGYDHIYRMTSEGSDIQQLTFGVVNDNTDPAWSPDRSQIAYVVSNIDGEEIWVMNADGTDATQVTNIGAISEDPTWSPDGTQLAFVVTRDAIGQQIHTINVDGTNLRQLTRNQQASSYAPAWSPDGTAIAYSSAASIGEDAEIWVMNPDGSNQRRLTNSNTLPGTKESPAWSVDGSKIAFAVNQGQFAQVYVMERDGSDLIPIASEEGAFITSPSWSPDNQAVAFSVSDRSDGTNEIRVVDIAGLESRALTPAEERAKLPSWGSEPDVSSAPPDLVAAEVEIASCGGNILPSRLLAGDTARLRPFPATAINLRDNAGLGAAQVDRIQPGTTMTILSGPECVDGYAWYNVDYEGTVGWTAESNAGEYWLEPFNYFVDGEGESPDYNPPVDRSDPPAEARLLSGGRGLTDGRRMPPGDFQVEYYCNTRGFGITNTDTDWYCTSGGSRVVTLGLPELDQICQETYADPAAYAIQDGSGSIPAYRWRCYVSR